MSFFLAQTETGSQAMDQVGLDAPGNFQEFVGFAIQTWVEGGWLMWPLAALAFFIYYEATALIFHMSRTQAHKIKPAEWMGWVSEPEKGHGHLGDVVRFAVAGGINEDAAVRVEAVRARLLPSVTQKIVVLSVLITLAPMMGLLGTIIGMLETFRGLAAGTGGQAADMVANGIRVALITTQTGLVIAIPGYLFIAGVIRRRNQYNGFLVQLESTLIQRAHDKRKEAA